jgi:hypothetical protein
MGFRLWSILSNTILGCLEIDQFPSILTPQNWNCNKILLGLYVFVIPVVIDKFTEVPFHRITPYDEMIIEQRYNGYLSQCVFFVTELSFFFNLHFSLMTLYSQSKVCFHFFSLCIRQGGIDRAQKAEEWAFGKRMQVG